MNYKFLKLLELLKILKLMLPVGLLKLIGDGGQGAGMSFDLCIRNCEKRVAVQKTVEFKIIDLESTKRNCLKLSLDML